MTSATMRLGLPLLLAALVLGGCGGAYRPRPASANPLESLIAVRTFPVYWLGSRFEGLPLTEVSRESTGAVSLQYGSCLQGGENTCVSPLTLVTSPDSSFLPHGAVALRPLRVRGVSAYATASRSAIEIPTGSVVVSIHADRAALARAAAAQLTPMNPLGQAPPIADLGLPGTPLQARRASDAVAAQPLPAQLQRPPR